MGRVDKHVRANMIANRHQVPKLAQESKDAFIAMQDSLTFDITPHANSSANEDMARVDSSWINHRAAVRGAELTMGYCRKNIDPCFKSLFVAWLKKYGPAPGFLENCPEFWKKLDGTLRPLAEEAGLYRREDGSWTSDHRTIN